MAFSMNKRILVGKLESSPGTAEWNLTSTFPADADFDNQCYNIEYSINTNMDEEVSKVATGDHGQLVALSGSQQGEISFSIPFAWGGAVATDPAVEKFLQGCGLYVNDYTTTGIGFQPLTACDGISMTLSVFETQFGDTPSCNGYLFKGCMGTATLSADGLGSKWALNFTFQGAFVGNYEIDASSELPTTTGFTTEVAEKLLSNTVTIQTETYFINSFTLDFGNTLSVYPDQSDSTGIKQFYISDRAPTLTTTAIMLPHATEDVYGKVTGETTGTISIASTNLTIYAPRAQMMNPGITDMEGLVGFEHTFKLLRNHNGNAAVLATIPDEATFEVLQGARA